MDTLSLAEAIYYDPEYSGSEDDMTNIRAIQTAIDQRIAEGRAAGYAEAKEQAAKLLDVAAASIHPELQLHERYDAIKKFATSTAATVRELAPAMTKEPT